MCGFYKLDGDSQKCLYTAESRYDCLFSMRPNLDRNKPIYSSKYRLEHVHIDDYFQSLEFKENKVNHYLILTHRWSDKMKPRKISQFFRQNQSPSPKIVVKLLFNAVSEQKYFFFLTLVILFEMWLFLKNPKIESRTGFFLFYLWHFFNKIWPNLWLY